MKAISDEDAIDLKRSATACNYPACAHEQQASDDAMVLALAELTGVEDADLDEYQRACLNAAIRALDGTPKA